MKFTYKHAFDRLTAAYINEEVNPFNCEACFVGNLLHNSSAWAGTRVACIYGGETSGITVSNYEKQNAILFIESFGYTKDQIHLIEDNFLKVISDHTHAKQNNISRMTITRHPNYENGLFKAFESTLKLLKKVHQDNGEIIDETPAFVKRALQPV